MAIIRTIARASIQNEVILPSETINTGRKVRHTVDAATTVWDVAGVNVTITTEISTDNGATWQTESITNFVTASRAGGPKKGFTMPFLETYNRGGNAVLVRRRVRAVNAVMMGFAVDEGAMT